MADDFLYVGTSGPEDPTRATLVFAAAIGMATHMREKLKDAPGTVRVALLGQGVQLMKDKIAQGICIVGERTVDGKRRSIFELMQDARSAKIEIHC